MIYVPPGARLSSHSPAQATNAAEVVCAREIQQGTKPTLTQFLDNFQQVFESAQASINSLREHVKGLEEELKRSRSETISLGRYAAWMMIDVENMIEANAALEASGMAIEAWSAELSQAAQKHVQENGQVHARAKNLEGNLRAVQTIIFNIASPY
jgi:translation initiation factor 2B subunit (eIF-2B alpha/beta/delta family)